MLNHTFVICAYKESAYLEDCIQSLLAQTVKSRILISTATPNDHISSLADKYGLEVKVNHGAHGIAEDWEFALRQAETGYVTLAHQDDVYEPEYAESILKAMEEAKDPIIAFSDYFELRDGVKVFAGQSKLLRIKQMILKPLRPRWCQRSKWIRRRCLSLGNAICCPAVTYAMDRMPDPLFIPGYKSNVDWQSWEILSKYDGEFVYVTSPLMGHRVHEDSTTSEVIGEGNGRYMEDYEMFCRFWPASIAKLLMRRYSKSQENNTIR